MYQASTCRVLGTCISQRGVVPQQPLPNLLSRHCSRALTNCNSRRVVCRFGTDDSASDTLESTNSQKHRAARARKAEVTPAAQGRSTSSSRRSGDSSGRSSSTSGSRSGNKVGISRGRDSRGVSRGRRPDVPDHVVQAMRRTSIIQETETPQQLLAMLERDAGDINHINLSAAYTHAVKLCRRGVPPHRQSAAVQQLLQQLHQLAEQLQQECDARGLSNIIWACARLSTPATVKLLMPAFLQASTLQQASPQAVSNVMWAAATLDVQLTEAEVQQLLQQLLKVLRYAKPQEISNTLWALATLRVQLTEQLVQQLVQRLIQVSPQATPQAVSNTLWAVATLRVQLSQGLVQQLVQSLVAMLPRANSQDIANIFWALATLKVQPSKGVVRQLLQQFVKRLPQAKPQEVSNTLWALATLEARLSEDLLQQLVQHFAKVLPHAKSQHVANGLWACGRLRYVPLQLLSALQEQPPQLEALLAASKPQEVANMAWACGQLGYSGELLPGLLLQQAGQLLQDSNNGSWDMQDLCNLCWSAATLDLQQYVPQVLQLAAACKDLQATAAGGEDLRQLYQVHLWLLDSQLPQPGQGLSGVLSQQQLQQCKDSWEQQLAEDTASVNTSQLQRSVFAALQALPGDTWQQAPVLEQLTADGAVSIDIAATTVSGVQLAIEVEGPNHYVQPNRTYSGSTLFRNRALAARGYVLVSIPYWEWDALRGAEQTQLQQYLLSRLQAAS